MKRITLVLFALAAIVVPAEGQETQGIEVHGHWKIEVFEADGTPVSTVEFENALTTDGAAHLAAVLGRGITQGLWSIYLDGGVQSTRPCSFTGVPSRCEITEAADFRTVSDILSKNLTVTSSGGQLVLAGSIAVTPSVGSPEVSIVATGFGNCTSSTGPGSCTGSASSVGLDFSSKTIGAVPVLPGQIVQATVTFTFS